MPATQADTGRRHHTFTGPERPLTDAVIALRSECARLAKKPARQTSGIAEYSTTDLMTDWTAGNLSATAVTIASSRVVELLHCRHFTVRANLLRSQVAEQVIKRQRSRWDVASLAHDQSANITCLHAYSHDPIRAHSFGRIPAGRWAAAFPWRRAVMRQAVHRPGGNAGRGSRWRE